MAAERGSKRALQVYNEQAFRYFLAIEGKRAVRSDRSLLLVLVDMGTETRIVIDPAVADKLFSVLTDSVREVDLIGWYRSDLVVGAVLTQGTATPAPDVRRQIGERIARTFGEKLPRKVASRINVRVLDLRSTPAPWLAQL